MRRSRTSGEELLRSESLCKYPDGGHHRYVLFALFTCFACLLCLFVRVRLFVFLLQLERLGIFNKSEPSAVVFHYFRCDLCTIFCAQLHIARNGSRAISHQFLSGYAGRVHISSRLGSCAIFHF